MYHSLILVVYYIQCSMLNIVNIIYFKTINNIAKLRYDSLIQVDKYIMWIL